LEGAKYPGDEIFRRINRHLKNRLKRPVDFFVALEASRSVIETLHVHGAISVGNDLSLIREALRSAGGAWREGAGRARQLDMRPIHESDGWAHYCCKDFSKTRRLMRKHDMSGSLVMVSRDLQRKAKSLYEDDRARFIKEADFINAVPSGEA
jgi:hypothetical protein